MKVLIIGVSGLIGSTTLRVLSEKMEWQITGTVRNKTSKRYFSSEIAANILDGVDLEQFDTVVNVIERIRPDIVINAAGLTKHKPEAEDPLMALPINSLAPHRLARICSLSGARFIHISSDCVFSGKKGNYSEDDFADARDVYGKSKALGEVVYPNSVTLRTSTIGHEFTTQYGLLEWFLSQEGRCKGFSRAVFSGLPTVSFAELIRDVVIPNTSLNGLYNVSAEPINKFDLLRLIAEVYKKRITIEEDDSFVIDRSLDSTRFRASTGYVAPSWCELISRMHAYK